MSRKTPPEKGSHTRLAQRRQRYIRTMAMELEVLLDGVQGMGVDNHRHRLIRANDEQPCRHAPSRQKGHQV
jgi:hypothetical protein